MKKLMARVHSSNKGFTLVELIIVIAIIAVLAAVLAPQYLKYVDKSKAANDANTMGAIVQSVNTLVADGTITEAETFTWNVSAGGLTSSLSTGAHTTDVTGITGTISAAKSKKVSALTDPTVAVTFASSGQPTVTVSPSDYTTWGN